MQSRLKSVLNSRCVEVGNLFESRDLFESRGLSESRCDRKSKRTPSYRFGVVYSPHGVNAQCIITNYSECGAKISYQGAETLPEVVMLRTIDSMRPRRARVVWKTQHEAGLKFED